MFKSNMDHKSNSSQRQKRVCSRHWKLLCILSFTLIFLWQIDQPLLRLLLSANVLVLWWQIITWHDAGTGLCSTVWYSARLIAAATTQPFTPRSIFAILLFVNMCRVFVESTSMDRAWAMSLNVSLLLPFETLWSIIIMWLIDVVLDKLADKLSYSPLNELQKIYLADNEVLYIFGIFG